jgi:hypothetical protein
LGTLIMTDRKKADTASPTEKLELTEAEQVEVCAFGKRKKGQRTGSDDAD